MRLIISTCSLVIFFLSLTYEEVCRPQRLRARPFHPQVPGRFTLLLYFGPESSFHVQLHCAVVILARSRDLSQPRYHACVGFYERVRVILSVSSAHLQHSYTVSSLACHNACIRRVKASRGSSKGVSFDSLWASCTKRGASLLPRHCHPSFLLEAGSQSFLRLSDPAVASRNWIPFNSRVSTFPFRGTWKNILVKIAVCKSPKPSRLCFSLSGSFWFCSISEAR